MKILNRTQIKYIVIVAMLIDHIAWGFVPMDTVLAQAMHAIGRLTGPTMAFFIAEGYVHTRNVRRYAARLGVFALLSWIPFTYFEYGRLPIYYDNFGSLCFGFTPGVIYTLFLALLALIVIHSNALAEPTKLCLLMLLLLLSTFGDWAVFDILFVIVFDRYRKDPKRTWGYFCVLAILNILCGSSYTFQIGVFFVPILLGLFYNGKSGSKAAFHKWFFYVFYPLHLIVLGVIRWAL